MIIINKEQWGRKEHFDFFLKSDLPFYNVNFNLDVSGLRKYAKQNGLSINNVLIHLTVKTLIGIDSFLYRYEHGNVTKYDTIDPSFACLRGTEELFRLVTVKYNDDVSSFDKIAKRAIQNSKSYFDLSLLRERSNFVFISALPWIPFTGIDHTASLRKEDAIPRISWGKIHEDNGMMILPYNIQVNHIFIDGLHVGRFYENIGIEIKNLCRRA